LICLHAICQLIASFQLPIALASCQLPIAQKSAQLVYCIDSTSWFNKTANLKTKKHHLTLLASYQLIDNWLLAMFS
jgi:hypothetical protein